MRQAAVTVVSLVLAMPMFASSAHAQAVEARLSSNGMRFEVRPLDGGVATIEPSETYFFVDGNIYSSQLRTYGFAQLYTGDAFPVDFDIHIENSVSRAEVLDDTGRSTVEIVLDRPNIHRDLAWSTRSTTYMQFALWLAPRSALTASTYISGEFVDPYATQFYSSITSWWTLSIGTSTIPVTSRYAQAGEWSEISITNETFAPMQVWFTSNGELNAQLQPLAQPAPVPEPPPSLLFGTGLLAVCAVALRRRRVLRRRLATASCRRQGTLSRIARCGPVLAAFILPFPIAGHAQTLDVSVRVGAVVGTADSFGEAASHAWSDIDMYAQVHQFGYARSGKELAATGSPPYPFEITANSGDSWARFGIDGDAALPHFSAHLDVSRGGTQTGPEPLYEFWGEIRATYANITVPAHSIGRIAMEIDVLPQAMASSPYTFSASIGYTSSWSTSTLVPTYHVLTSPYYEFDNSDSATPMSTGPVYFVSVIYATAPTPAVPEPSAAAMLALGMLLLGGVMLVRQWLSRRHRSAIRPFPALAAGSGERVVRKVAVR